MRGVRYLEHGSNGPKPMSASSLGLPAAEKPAERVHGQTHAGQKIVVTCGVLHKVKIPASVSI